MDRARQRFASNLRLLTKFNAELVVMGDRNWTNECHNSYIQHMAKKMWLYDFTPLEVTQVNKAVTGYLGLLELRAKANPVKPGGHVVKGEILSVKRVCEDQECSRHWKMGVRDDVEGYSIYTPIPLDIADQYTDMTELIGHTVSYYAYLTASERDPSFGFAHRPKLMTIEEKRNAR